MAEMQNYICTVCGGALGFDGDGKRAVCKYCGSEFFFKEEKGSALVLALNSAAGYLHRHDFESAIVNYESILKEYPSDAEAAWGHAISTYGIIFEKDDRSGQMIPTCSRIIKESILQNKSYLLAISECAEEQRPIYEKKAVIIDKVQKRIKRAMEDEEDFDVFLSFKASDVNGIATEDSVIARNIYDELQKKGIKTFFSEVTLADRIGDEYEPIIYRALYSCKFFILVATKEEYVEAPWVKNEWTRFRDRAAEENLSGSCTAVFKGFSPYILPKVFQSQGVDLEKHPFDYAKLIADNLAVKFGIISKDKEELEEQKRKNAELEEKLRKLEEAQKNTFDQKSFAELMKQFEADKKRADEEANKRNAELEEEAKHKIEKDKRRDEAKKQKQIRLAEIRRAGRLEEEFKNIFKIRNECITKYKGKDKNVEIPYGVTSIGDGAFYECGRIATVKIPNSVASLGENAFGYCADLTNVLFEEFSDLTSISYGAFRGCKSLASIKIPDSVTSIDGHAFRECSGLREIEIPDSVTSIGEYAFRDCSGLTKVKIPKSVTSIGDYSFYGCNNLENIIVDENNAYYKSIDGNLYTKDGKTLILYATGKSESEFELPNGVTRIDACAFLGCRNLVSVKISDGVTSIGDEAFCECKNLVYIEIPESIKTIGEYAFWASDKLRIYVKSLKNIDEWGSDWSPVGTPVFDKTTGRQIKKNLFGKWK